MNDKTYSIELHDVTIDYTCYFSRRLTLAMEVKNGELVVRAPLGIGDREINRFLTSHATWILRTLNESRRKADAKEAAEGKFSDLEKQEIETEGRKRALWEIQKAIAEFQPRTGGEFKRISIKEQKTRWGSCSSNGTLSFHWKLIFAPKFVRDYVVVHELCHLTYMNHSEDFWNLVASVMPDYKIRRKWLKNHSTELSATYEPILYEAE